MVRRDKKSITVTTGEKPTPEFTAYAEQLLSTLSLGDIIRILDCLKALANRVREGDLVGDEAEERAESMRKILADFQTKEKCPRCGMPLYMSDLPQYHYVCHDCDENF